MTATITARLVPVVVQRAPAQVACCDVEKQEFEALYTRLREPLFAYAATRLPAQVALDVVHDTFEVVWKKRAEAPADSDGRVAWCFGIGRNKVLQEAQRVRRKHHDNRFLEGLSRAPEPALDDVAEAVVEAAAGRAIWEHLSADDRELVVVVASGDLSGAQMASLLGISPVAFRRRLSRLRVRIAAGLLSSAAGPEEGGRGER